MHAFTNIQPLIARGLVAVAILTLGIQAVADAGTAGPVWDVEAWSKPPATYPADEFHAEGMRGLFFEGLPWHGKPTRLFAWIGIPKVEPGKKVPGIVLVHGGGGTAYEAWVRLWVSRGYAAIAMDNCGSVPVRADPKTWTHHEAGGPKGWGSFAQMKDAPQDQWSYHAVADAILTHSLLRAQPEVDAERTGITGISWGGYLTCMIAGLDDRFKFAVSVYGCGFTNEHLFNRDLVALGPERAAQWMRWWDPSVYLPKAKMPMLWVDGSNDFAYTLNAVQKSYRLPPGPRTLCTRLRMPHGHGGPGENPKEIQVFAESILSKSEPLAKITAQGRNGGHAWATFASQSGITKADLNFTKDSGPWQQRKWESIPATIEGQKVSAEIPEGSTVFYLNLTDGRNCVVRTEHEELGVAAK